MSELVDHIRHFWLDLWNRHALEEMRGEFHPDYKRTDHRALTEGGSSRSDWEEISRAWWELSPDVAVVEFELLAEAREHIVYYLLFSGHDNITGGRAEVPFYVVNEMRDGRFLSADLFDDREAALAWFASRRPD